MIDWEEDNQHKKCINKTKKKPYEYHDHDQ
jgi:hypothetical protein